MAWQLGLAGSNVSTWTLPNPSGQGTNLVSRIEYLDLKQPVNHCEVADKMKSRPDGQMATTRDSDSQFFGSMWHRSGLSGTRYFLMHLYPYGAQYDSKRVIRSKIWDSRNTQETPQRSLAQSKDSAPHSWNHPTDSLDFSSDLWHLLMEQGNHVIPKNGMYLWLMCFGDKST